MNIVICEDDIQFCNYIKSILEKYIVNNHFNSKIVLTTSNPDNVINYIHNNSEITIYYLDNFKIIKAASILHQLYAKMII